MARSEIVSLLVVDVVRLSQPASISIGIIARALSTAADGLTIRALAWIVYAGPNCSTTGPKNPPIESLANADSACLIQSPAVA